MDDIKPVGEKSTFGAIIFFLVGFPLFLIGMIFVVMAIFANKSGDIASLEIGVIFAVFAIIGLYCMQRARCYAKGTVQTLPDLNPIVVKTMQITYPTMILLRYLESPFPEFSSIIEYIIGILFVSPFLVWVWLRINPSKLQ
jgi:uncharacterized membrane protein